MQKFYFKLWWFDSTSICQIQACWEQLIELIRNKVFSTYHLFNAIDGVTYESQVLIRPTNQKKGRFFFFYSQATWWPLFWETHFFRQRCAILNHSQNAMSILVPTTFYFFVGREVTLPSSLQHHQGNYPNSFVTTIYSICDYIPSLIVTCMLC